MEQDYSFLKILLNEDIYVINEEKESAIEEATLKYYGENKKHITVIVEEVNPDFMRSVSFQFLNKIMEAVKLSQHEYALINLQENKACTLERIMKELAPNHIIIFGESDFSNLDNYEISEIEGSTMLQSDSLTDVQTDVEKKKALWKALQEVFS